MRRRYPSDCGKRKPPRDARGVAAQDALHRVRDTRVSAPDVAADDVAEQLPLLTLEPLQLKLADRGEIGWAGVDRNAGQQDFGAEILEACRLLHDVLAGEIVAALLQHLNQRLGDAVADDDGTVELVAFRKILLEEGKKFLHAGVILPLRIANIFHITGVHTPLPLFP